MMIIRLSIKLYFQWVFIIAFVPAYLKRAVDTKKKVECVRSFEAQGV